MLIDNLLLEEPNRAIKVDAYKFSKNIQDPG